MTLRRPWIATLLALSWSFVAAAQTDTGSSGAGGGGTGGGGTSGPSGSTGGGGTAPGSAFSSTNTQPATSGTGTPGASSSFGGSEPTTSGGGGSLFDIFSSNRGGGAESTGGTATVPAQTAPSFVLPGLYGQGSQSYSGGSGRLAKPKFELGLSFSIGYDDNVFQTPTDASGGTIQVLEPGEPAKVVQTGTRLKFVQGGGVVEVPVFGVEPGTPDRIRDVKVPGPERLGSFLTQSNINLEMQQYTRRSLFTLDLRGGRTYYWDKDEDPVDYNGNLSANYLYRFSPRLQTTAMLNVAYLSQPDLSRVNTPDRIRRGDLINPVGRLDLTYRFTPRISTTATASYNGSRYTDKAEQVGDYDEWTFGLEGRYLWKPRWTLLAEFRHAISSYPNQPTGDAVTEYALAGSEFVINPRLNGTLRLGASAKNFDVGTTHTAPYGEATLSYRATSRSNITWTNRYGFEESANPDEERLVYRTSLGYSYAFTPRLRGNASINFVHEKTTNQSTNSAFTQDSFDSNLGLEYQLTKQFSLNASYAFTDVSSNTKTNDYYRNRVYFGGLLTF